jgi:hypothetical protein
VQPIVPDRTAFGAAIEREAHGNHAEHQCQSPEHHTLPPALALYGLNPAIFKPRRPVAMVASAFAML